MTAAEFNAAMDSRRTSSWARLIWAVIVLVTLSFLAGLSVGACYAGFALVKRLVQ